MKEKVEKFDFVKTENICFVKDPRKRMKKNKVQPGRKYVQTQTKRLLYKTYKELSKFNRKTTIQKCLTKEDTQMSNKHVKTCSTSYVIREMQIKTAVRYHPMYLLEWPKFKTTTPNIGEDMEHQELSLIGGRNSKRHSHFGI